MRPTTAAFWASALLVGRQPVEPRGEDGLDGRWDLDLLDRPRQLPGAIGQSQDAPVDEHPDELLGEERVAIGEADDALAQRGRQAAGEQAIDQRRVSSALERLEDDRRRVGDAAAPRRAPVEELVAREAEDGDRALAPAREVLDEVEQALVGPMDVLQDEDQRRDCLRRAPR